MKRPLSGMLAFALAVAACAIPTEAPNWDVTWNLPVPQEDGPQTISVEDFLPNGVTLNPPTPPATVSSSFNVTPSAIPPITRTLGANCPSCPSGTAPKPAFVAPVASTNITLPSEVASGTIATGSQIVVTVNNGFSFDPIRPPGGANGQITLTITNGATTLGTLTLNGATTAIPANAVTTLPPITLSGTFNASQPIQIVQTMDSPAGAVGQPVNMAPTHAFSVSATPTINVSSATVNLAAQSIDSPPENVSLADIDTSIARRIPDSTTTQGRLILTITTPFSVSATATMTIAGGQPLSSIQKTITIPAATGATSTYEVPVNLTGKELRSILGRDITVGFNGTTSPGSTVVTPTSAITMTARMQVHLYMREIK